MDNGPNYDNYSWKELLDVYENIDRDRYSDRFAKVAALLGKLEIPSTLASEINANVEVGEEIDEQTREINKAQRIKDFFDSLESGNSDFLSSSSGDGFSSSDAGGGGE